MTGYKRKPIKFSSLPSSAIVLGAVFLTIVVVTSVLWTVNSGPQIPSISYVPNEIVISPKPDTGKTIDQSYGKTYLYLPEKSIELNSRLTNEERLKIIQEKYRIIFYKLRHAYENEFNRMAQYAKNDYLAVNQGAKNTSVSKLALDYSNKAKQLEENCDNQFYKILEAMKNELRENNLPLDLTLQVEKEYKDQKATAKNELMMKIARVLND